MSLSSRYPIRHFRFSACLSVVILTCALTACGAESHHAELFEPGVISSETTQDLAITVSPDGSTLYFNRRLEALRHDPERTGAIWWTQRVDDEWIEPRLTSFSGAYSTVDPMISPDGARLSFMSTRPLEGEEPMEKADLSVRDRIGEGYGDDQWGTPRHPGFTVNRDDATDGAPSVTASGALYFFSDREGGFGSADVYRSPWTEDGYGPPENLGDIINSPGWDGHPFVAPDESYLVYMSDREDSGHGGCDLYISYRRDDGWAAPINLGPEVNSPQCDMLPYVHPDGDTFFFTRVDEAGAQNIYSIPTESVGALADPGGRSVVRDRR